jgi:hypothetical protein
MSIPAGYKQNQWGWFYRESDNSGPYYLGPDMIMHQWSAGAGELTVDAWGVSKISAPYSLFHGMWTYDIPNNMWFTYHNGLQVYDSTLITSAGGAAKVTTGGATTVALLESRECPRYQPNRGHLYSTALWAPDKTADGVRDFGLFTSLNGVFFRLKGDGLLYAVVVSNGVEMYSQPIDTSRITGFDVEKNNIYDIQFQWRGAGNYLFFIGDPESGVSRFVHKIEYLGTLTRLTLENPALPMSYRCTKVTEDVELNIGCVDVTSENGQRDSGQYASAYTGATSANGTNIPVIAMRSPLTILGKVNTRDIELGRITVTCDKKATFKVWTFRDPAAIIGATFASMGHGSFVESDSPFSAIGAVRATSVNTALMRPLLSIPVQAGVTREQDNPLLLTAPFKIVRGDYLVVTCTASVGSCDVVIEWAELI